MIRYPAMEDAFAAGMLGWSLRCNRCGSYGAQWIPGERPGWGSLALCLQHAEELREEMDRHSRALIMLRQVNFHQEPCAQEKAEALLAGKRWPPSDRTRRRRYRALAARRWDD
jgi:hypothetical protein